MSAFLGTRGNFPYAYPAADHHHAACRLGDLPVGDADIYIFARTGEFSSRASFDTPARRVGIGGPVVGFLEPTSRGPLPDGRSGRHLHVKLESVVAPYHPTPSPWGLSATVLLMPPQQAADNL